MRADNIDGQNEEDMLMQVEGDSGQSLLAVSAMRLQSGKSAGSSIFDSSF